MKRFLMVLPVAALTAAASLAVSGAGCDDRYPWTCAPAPAAPAAASVQAPKALGAPPARRTAHQHRQAPTRHAVAPARPARPAPQAMRTIVDPRAPLRLPGPDQAQTGPEPPSFEARMAMAHEAFQTIAVDQPTLTAFFSVAPRKVATVAIASPAEAAVPVIEVADAGPLTAATWPAEVYEPERPAADVPVIPREPPARRWLRPGADLIVPGAGAVAAALTAWLLLAFHRASGWSRATARAASFLLGLRRNMNVWKRIRDWNDQRLARKSTRERLARAYVGARPRGDKPRLPDGEVWPIGRWRAESEGRRDDPRPLGARAPDDSAIGAWSRAVQASERSTAGLPPAGDAGPWPPRGRAENASAPR